MSVAEAPRTWWTKTARIKEKFPNPGRGDSHGASSYCVGGAFLKFHHLNGGFPSTTNIAKGLVIVNSAIPYPEAINYAREIVRHNDDGDFCEAWETLERALTY